MNIESFRENAGNEEPIEIQKAEWTKKSLEGCDKNDTESTGRQGIIFLTRKPLKNNSLLKTENLRRRKKENSTYQ